MRSLELLTGLVLLTFNAGFARAGCECLCVDGALLTLCGTLDEARRPVDRCGARDSQRCPVDLDAPVPRSYPAPSEGARDCRDVQVFDAARQVHVSTKVCDVAPGP